MRTTIAAVAVVVLAASGWAAYLARPAPVRMAGHSAAARTAATAARAQHRPDRAGPAAGPVRRPVVYDCRGKPRTAPARYILTCADGGIFLTGVRWSSWSAAGATGVGRLAVNNCRPDCAQGTFGYTRVAVTLSVPHSGHGGAYFTRLRITGPAVASHLGRWQLGPQGP